jgi:hypothetical protein
MDGDRRAERVDKVTRSDIIGRGKMRLNCAVLIHDIEHLKFSLL